ncbi:MAG: lipoprotein-releasing ABC transporter permease subunit [Moraxellaceae bacterium]|nr:lipoprotein-releasing ABC transporter permease subunit [Moraxellaceae bacterium]
MQRPFSLFIALRLFRSKNSNKFLSFISWISILGLILGVASLIVVTSVLNGFEQTLNNKILGMVPHVRIQADKPIENWQEISQQIKQNDPNVKATAPFVMARGMTSIYGDLHGTIINGIDPKQQKKVSVINDIMVEGSLDKLTPNSNHIVLGKTLVEKNGLKIGDSVSLFIANPAQTNSGIKPKFATFTLVGVFSATDKVDSWMSYVSMADLSHLLGVQSGVRGIRLKLNHVMQAEKILTKSMTTINNMNNNSNINYKYYQWKQTHGSIYKTINMQKTMIALLLFLIILVAGFNIIATLVMLVSEKRADIAILKTYGATPRLVFQIFVNQGIIVGVFGTTIGTILGLSIALVIEDVSQWVNSQFELGLFDNYFVNALVTDIQLLDILFILSATLITSILATIYPAYTASKTKPALILNDR